MHGGPKSGRASAENAPWAGICQGQPMSTDKRYDAALALHRFGFGPRGDAIAQIASDPRGAFLAELDRPDAALIHDPDLLDSGEAPVPPS